MSAATRAGRVGIVEGEFLFTAADLAKIIAIMHNDAGIAISPGKASLVYGRLVRRLRALDLADFASYCELVIGPDGSEERGNMLAALTTNVTGFFREPHHFDHLRTELLPPLLKAAKQGRRVRIWSAACSTGQEPYSIALVILGLLPEAPRLDIRVLATDIDPNVTRVAREGVYSAEALGPVQTAQQQRWFSEMEDGQWMAGEGLRALVAFRNLNLIGQWPMQGSFDAIFCRNVVIYFDEATQARIWSRFAPLIPGGGYLYIGHSERVSGPAAAQFASNGVTRYRRCGAVQ